MMGPRRILSERGSKRSYPRGGKRVRCAWNCARVRWSRRQFRCDTWASASLVATVVLQLIISVSFTQAAIARREVCGMRANHVHVGVRDLPAAIGWLERAGGIKPVFPTPPMGVFSVG